MLVFVDGRACQGFGRIRVCIKIMLIFRTLGGPFSPPGPLSSENKRMLLLLLPLLLKILMLLMLLPQLLMHTLLPTILLLQLLLRSNPSKDIAHCFTAAALGSI